MTTYSKTALKGMDRTDLIATYEQELGTEAPDVSNKQLIQDILDNQAERTSEAESAEGYVETVIHDADKFEWSEDEFASPEATAEAEPEEIVMEPIEASESELLGAIDSSTVVEEAPEEAPVATPSETKAERAPRGSRASDLVNGMTMSQYRWMRKVVGKTPNRLVHDLTVSFAKSQSITGPEASSDDNIAAALTLYAAEDDNAKRASELAKAWWSSVSGMARSRLTKEIQKAVAGS